MSVWLPGGNGSTGRIECGSDASLDDWTELTYWAWIWPHSSTYFGRIFNKGDQKDFHINGTGDGKLNFLVRRTSNGFSQDNVNLGITEWKFVAATFEPTDGPRLYKGDLTTLVDEVASYQFRGAGSGTVLADAAFDLKLGQAGTNVRALGGRISVAGAVNRKLSVAELRDIQFRPRCVPDTGGFWICDNFASIPDCSGNGNSGVPGGTRQQDVHPPLGPWYGIDEAIYPEAPAVSADVLSRGLSGISQGVIASTGGGHSGLHPIDEGFVS